MSPRYRASCRSSTPEPPSAIAPTASSGVARARRACGPPGGPGRPESTRDLDGHRHAAPRQPEHERRIQASRTSRSPSRRPASRRSGKITGPADRPDQVALAVAEPRGALPDPALARVVALHPGDAVDRPQARDVDHLEHHPARAELAHRGIDVGHLPAHLGALARRRAGRFEQGERAAAPDDVEQAAGALLGGLEAQLLRVEASRPLEVLRGQARRDRSALQARPHRETLLAPRGAVGSWPHGRRPRPAVARPTDRGRPVEFSFADLMRYHGPGSPGGVAHAFAVLERALPAPPSRPAAPRAPADRGPDGVRRPRRARRVRARDPRGHRGPLRGRPGAGRP